MGNIASVKTERMKTGSGSRKKGLPVPPKRVFGREEPVFLYRKRGNPNRKWAAIRSELLRKLEIRMNQELHKLKAEARMPLFPENDHGKKAENLAK